MSPADANAVRGEVVPFPPERIMWVRPKPSGPLGIALEPGQVAVVLEGVTMVYASRDAFEARFCAPAPAPRAATWRGQLIAAAVGASLAALALWCRL